MPAEQFDYPYTSNDAGETDFEKQTTESATSPATNEPLGRFGIGQMMLWTMGSGIHLVLSNWITTAEQFSTDETPLSVKLFIAAGAIPVGGILAGMLTLIVARIFRTKRLLFAPGHWLIANMLVICVWDLATRMALILVMGPIMSATELRTFYVVTGFGHLLTAIGYLLATVARESVGWRWLLGSLAVIELLEFLLLSSGTMMFQLHATLLGITAVVVGLIAYRSLLDIRQGKHRDWVHNLGVIGVVSFVLLSIASYLVYFLF